MALDGFETINDICKMKVFDVLITPIICKKNRSKEIEIKRENGIIFSSQQYYSTADEDMSDFAVRFYEILYGDTLLKDNKSVLDKKGRFIKKELAGDTMNSFNTIANMYRRQYTRDPGNIMIPMDAYLMYYKLQYHCLANFWLIPMWHGRKSSKTVLHQSAYDSPVLYTKMVNENWEKLSTPTEKEGQKYSDYFCMISKEEFRNIHYLPDQLYEEGIRQYYSEKNGLELIKQSLNFIFERARKISESNISAKLYVLFTKYNLLD